MSCGERVSGTDAPDGPSNPCMSTYRFASGVEFDSRSGELRHEGRVTRLEPQPAALLALLAERAGALVTHEEIARHLWADGTHVDFRGSAHYCVRQIRAALGDPARYSQVIETVPRRGYRLRANALWTSPSGDAADPEPGAETPRRGWPARVAFACLAVAILVGVAVVERRPNNHHETAAGLVMALHDLVY